MASNDMYFSQSRSNPGAVFVGLKQRSCSFGNEAADYYKPVIGGSVRSSGKLYFEIQFSSLTARQLKVGLCNGSMGSSEVVGTTPNSWVFDLYSGRVQHNSSPGSLLVDGLPTDAVIAGAGHPVYRENPLPITVLGINHGTLWACVAADLDTGKMWIGLNGIWSGDPERGIFSEFNTASLSGVNLSIVCALFAGAGTGSTFLLNVLQEEFRWRTPRGFRPWGDPERSTVKVTVKQANVPSTINNFPLKLSLSNNSGSLSYDATLNHRVLATLAGDGQRNQKVGWTLPGACVRLSDQYNHIAKQSYQSSAYPPPNAVRTRPFFVTGRYYFELEIITISPVSGATQFRFGLCTEDTNMNGIIGQSANDKAIVCGPELGWRMTSFTGEPGCPTPNVGYIWAPTITFANGDRISFVVDMDQREFYLAHNGTWINSSNPETRTNPVFTVIPEEHVYCFFTQFGTRVIPAPEVELITEESLFEYPIPTGCKVIAGVQKNFNRIAAKTLSGTALDVEIANWNSALSDISSLATVTGSSQYSGTTLPSYVVDGWTSFFWRPADGNLQEWLRFDFGAGFSRRIATVTITFDHTQQAPVYQGVITAALQTSDNGTDFTTVATAALRFSTIEFDLRDTDITFASASPRYWRIHFTKTQTTNSFIVYEVTVRALDASPSATVWVKVPSLLHTQDNDILLDFYKDNYQNPNLKAAGVISTLPNNNHNVNVNQLLDITSPEALASLNSTVQPASGVIPVEHVRTTLFIGANIVESWSTRFLQALGRFVILRTSAVSSTSGQLSLQQISTADTLTMMTGGRYGVHPESTTIGFMVQNEMVVVDSQLEFEVIDIYAEFGYYAELEIEVLDIEAIAYQVTDVISDADIPAIDCEAAIYQAEIVDGLCEIAGLTIESTVSARIIATGLDMDLLFISVDGHVGSFADVAGEIDVAVIDVVAVVAGSSSDEFTMKNIDGGADWQRFPSV